MVIYFLITSCLIVTILIIVLYSKNKNFDNVALLQNISMLEQNLSRINDSRKEEHYKLSEQIRFLIESSNNLQNETSKLSQLLRTPQMRGKWGEMQLKNIVETTGMNNYTSFDEQITIKDSGESFRPDLVIRIPGQRKIIVDSKAPFNSYLEAYETNDDNVYKIKIADHVKSLRNHIRQLGQKKYWNKISASPPFVILFLPVESFLSVSMSHDKDLLNYAESHDVVVMTPILLLAMLRIIAHGWQQEKIYENSKEIFQLSGDLQKNIQNILLSFEKLGSNLNNSVSQYNKLTSILESKILDISKKLNDMGIGKNSVNSLQKIDSKVQKSEENEE